MYKNYTRVVNIPFVILREFKKEISLPFQLLLNWRGSPSYLIIIENVCFEKKTTFIYVV